MREFVRLAKGLEEGSGMRERGREGGVETR